MTPSDTKTPTIPALDQKVLESLSLRGDLSALGAEDRAAYYRRMCEQLGLNPHAQPFAFLRLNGKEILYATRGATDQLAAIHRLNREIVDGPKVIDLAGTKLVYAVCRATHPNGRVETATATVPLTDPINVLMKAETKAKRRATLSILGLGLLDEMELETIPANAQEPGGGVDLSQANHHDEAERPEPPPAEVHPVLEAFYSRVGEIELPGEGVSVWMKHRAELGPLNPADRENAWKALCKKVEDVGKMKNAKVWLKKAIAEEDARRASTGAPCAGPTDGGPSSDWTATPEGMTRRAAELGDDGAVLADARLHFDLVGYAQALTARLVAFGHQHDDAAALIARTQREARERAKRTPPDDGSGGGARHSAKRSTRAEGHGADAPSPSSAPSNALTLVRDEVAEPGEPLTLARWRSHLDAPDAKGRPATKGLVAGRWWKHRAELDAAGLHDDAWAAVIAALYVLRVQNPEAWIESCRPGRQRSAPTPRTTKTTAPATQAA